MIKFTGGRWLAVFAVFMMSATSLTVPSKVDGAYAAAAFIILCRLVFVVLWCAMQPWRRIVMRTRNIACKYPPS